MSNSPTPKPTAREFWLNIETNDIFVSEKNLKFDSGYYEDCITCHVIEYSAFSELESQVSLLKVQKSEYQRVNAALEKELADEKREIKSLIKHNYNLQNEILTLEKELADKTKALKLYANRQHWSGEGKQVFYSERPGGQEARETLDRWKK